MQAYVLGFAIALNLSLFQMDLREEKHTNTIEASFMNGLNWPNTLPDILRNMRWPGQPLRGPPRRPPPIGDEEESNTAEGGRL